MSFSSGFCRRVLVAFVVVSLGVGIAAGAGSANGPSPHRPSDTATLRGLWLPSYLVAKRARERANQVIPYYEEKIGVYVRCLRYSSVKVRCPVRILTFIESSLPCLDPNAGTYVTRRFTEVSYVNRRTGRWTSWPKGIGFTNQYVSCPSWAQL